MKPPRPPRRNSGAKVIALLEELASRPAMNGGFQKLAEQQEAQLEQLQHLKSRIDPIEDFVVGWRKSQKWLLRGVGAVFFAVLTELVVQVLTHLHVTLH